MKKEDSHLHIIGNEFTLEVIKVISRWIWVCAMCIFLFGLPGSHVRSRNTNNAILFTFLPIPVFFQAFIYGTGFFFTAQIPLPKLHFIVVEVLEVVIPSKLVKQVNLALFIQRSRQRMGKA